MISSGNVLAYKHIIENFSSLNESSLTWVDDMRENILYPLAQKLGDTFV